MTKYEETLKTIKVLGALEEARPMSSEAYEIYKCSMLIDIAKSLAVIADVLMVKNNGELKNGRDNGKDNEKIKR